MTHGDHWFKKHFMFLSSVILHKSAFDFQYLNINKFSFLLINCAEYHNISQYRDTIMTQVWRRVSYCQVLANTNP